MGKRKAEDSEDRRRRKIRKMEKKIAKYKQMQSKADDDSPDTDPEVVIDHSLTDEDVEDLREDPESSQGDTEVVVHLEDEPAAESMQDSELPQDILAALGDSNLTQKGYGEKIHPTIFSRIDSIIIEGMPKELKDSILKKYLIPENCTLLEAPKVNLELLGVIKQSGKARDKLLQERQQELGVATAVVCKAIHALTKENFDKLETIKMLTDATRLLGNLHFQYTEIRRKLIAPFMDKDLSQNLKENQRSDFLYTRLEESVKSLTTIKRASNILKPKVPHKVPKNFQPPRRSGQFYPGKNVQRGGHRPFQHQQARPQTSQVKMQERRHNPSTSTMNSKGRAKYP